MVKNVTVFFAFLMVTSFLYPIINFDLPKEAIEIVRPWLPENPIILEAGAYDGTDTMIMSDSFKGCTIHAFEPVAQIYQKLHNKVQHCANIKTYNIALSDSNGTVVFYLSYDQGMPSIITQSSSLLPPKEHFIYAPSIQFKESIITTITLDAWAEKEGVDHIDFMWLDLQGYELNVLKASPMLFDTVKAILLEVEFVEAYKGQYLFDDIKIWLESKKFELIATSFGQKWYGDALFVKKG